MVTSRAIVPARPFPTTLGFKLIKWRGVTTASNVGPTEENKYQIVYITSCRMKPTCPTWLHHDHLTCRHRVLYPVGRVASIRNKHV